MEMPDAFVREEALLRQDLLAHGSHCLRAVRCLNNRPVSIIVLSQ
jgi:hypothetical protein